MQHRHVAVTFLVILTLMIATIGRGSIVEAVVVPPISTPFYIQTSSPSRALNIGDWYTNSSLGAGNGYHYFTLHVPCGWPSSTPIHIDLFHPDLNSTSGSGVSDEITTVGTTVFEVYQPGTTLNPPIQPAPAASGSLSQVTYNPNTVGPYWTRFFTITAPVTCGTYILRAQTNGNADNSWQLRFGSDNDNDPNTLPPLNYDNPDALPGTGDELTIGLSATTFQHDAAGTPCLTLHEYVAPGQSSVTFHNFDMDLQTRVRYYSPIDTYDPLGLSGGTAGTLSGNAVWNNSNSSSRVGDTIANPEPGWWRIVSCINNNNQFIQEGQTSVLSYMDPPPAPHLTLSKTDGVTVAAPGDIITYTLTFTNTGNPITSPGAAYNVVLTDTLPAQVIYINHDAPNGILTHSSGTVVYTRTNQLNYNETDTITITVQVDPSLTSTVTFTNTAVLDYQDGFGNQYPQVQASDSVTINQPNIELSKTDGVTTAAPGQTLTYTLTFTNTGAGAAHNITISDPLPTGVSYQSCDAGALGGTCSASGGTVTFTLTNPLAAGGSASVTITGVVTAGGPATLTNTATLNYTDSANNPRPSVTASDTTTVPAQPNIVLSKTDGVTTAAPGQSLTYTLTFTNTGAGAAHNIMISDVLPSELMLPICTPGSLGGTCSVSGSSVTYTAPTTATLGVGQSSTITITAQVPITLTSGATLTNTATLNYTDSGGNARTPVTASDTTTVPAQPTIELSKTDGVTTAAPGQTLTYTLTFTNTGAGAAHNITISDPLPTGVSYQSCDAGALGGTCSVSGGTVTFTLTNPLAAGGSASVTITGVVTAGGPATLTNTATLNYTDSGGNARTPVTASDTTTVPAQPTIELSKTDGGDDGGAGADVDLHADVYQYGGRRGAQYHDQRSAADGGKLSEL
ncbi:DUF11 domain-containing protein [Chloroflexus sp. Y-396-1]|uniref:COG1361 S-layer family protein n=1 Tax=Chloroflexus sp. Y-396-1 TaxID=867845 RepID=UPI0004B14C61|nr:DUF11 domain-containing protein [Chloroflexus sp. Y-396-1]